MTLAWIALALAAGAGAAFVAYWWGVGVAEARARADIDCALDLYRIAEAHRRSTTNDLVNLINRAGVLADHERAAFDAIAANYTRKVA